MLRFPLILRPPPSSSSTLFNLLSSLLFSLHALSLSSASPNQNSNSPPTLDWSALGQVALLGSFDGLSFYNASANHSLNDINHPNHATLLAHHIPQSQNKQQPSCQSSPSPIATTDQGGSILAICSSPSSPLIFIAGQFNALNAIPNTANIAIYNSQNRSISPLDPSRQINGTVHAISCAQDDQVWIAGQFTNPISPSLPPNIVLWSASQGFQNPTPQLPTLNGPVYSIQHLVSPAGESLIIGGKFSIPFILNNDNQNSSLFSTDLNITQTPSLGSSLAPIVLSSKASSSASPPSPLNGYQSPQNVFCPSGPDGPGNSWELDPAFSDGVFILNLGTAVQAGGIRLGNSFANGGGTAGFHVVALPDNKILNMTFIDPVTSQLSSCQNECTLSRDFRINYQDFLFPPGTSLTGVQVVITSKYGNVAGLHLLQLLSNGNTAYAVDQLNSPAGGQACRSGIGAVAGSNSAITTGTWKTVAANAIIPGAIQPVLASTVAPGTTPANGPSITWSVWVPQAGSYDLALYTPGCSRMGDCATRTTVAVTVTPAGGQSTTTTVDTRNTADASTTLFNGTLSSSDSSGALTVTMRLAGTVSAASVELVADQLVLRAHSPTNASLLGIPSNGVYEHVLAGKGAFGDGSTAASVAVAVNTSMSAVDRLGVTLRPGSAVRAVISDDHLVFVAGEQLTVSSGPAGVATTVSAVPNGGLNGVVQALVATSGVLYAGGNFNATSDGKVTGLGGLARWHYEQAGTSWEPLGAGLTGAAVGAPIQAMQLTNGLLFIVGHSSEAGLRGLGVYSPQNASWVEANAGVYFGNLTALAVGAQDSKMVYVAGNIVGAGAVGVPSGAMVSTGPGGVPVLSGFGFQINHTASQAEALVSSVTRKVLQVQSPRGVAAAPRRVRLARRQLPSAGPVNASLPYALTGSTAGTILTGAFWRGQELLLGGRFVSTEGVANIGIYDAGRATLRGLNGTQTLRGEVLAIKVIGDVAWVGGQFESPSGRTGLDTYNLTSGRWATQTMVGVGAYADTNVSVRAIRSRGADVVVAGQFQSLGSLPCQSICVWLRAANQWVNLGNGLRGTVNGIELLGKTQEELVAVGRFAINQTVTDAAVAQWRYGSDGQSWSALGSQEAIPGMVRTIAVGELGQGTEDGMFIGGQRSDGGGMFLMSWRGGDWAAVEGLGAASRIEQVAFVPVREPSPTVRTVNGLKSDRLVMVSGLIEISGTDGRFGSVLYDGQRWFPYLTSVAPSGGDGILSRIVTTSEGFKSAVRRVHSTAAVIVISMAIALGIVFVGVLLGLLFGLYRRAEEKKAGTYPGPGVVGGQREDEEESEGEGSAEERRRPTSLLATIDAATAAMTERMVHHRDGEPVQVAQGEKEGAEGGMVRMAVGEEAKGAEGVGGGEAYVEVAEDGDGEADVRRARWSFDPQLPGEVAVGAGEYVEVRDRSNQEWWLVRRADGVEGVVPADWFL